MRWPTLPLSTRRHRAVLGMDIGADGVRLAMTRTGGDGLRIEWTEEVSLTELQGFADYDSVLPRLEALIRERVPARTPVATVPPWNSARVVVEEMPRMDAARFAKAANWYFSRNQHEDMLQPVDLGIPQAPRTTVEGKEVLDGVMVSMDRVMLTGLADMCASLDLKLQWLVPSPLCFSTLLSHGEGGRAELVLDVGSGQTRMVLSMDGHVRLVRKLKPSANEIVRSLADKLEVGWETAHHVLLATSGLGPLAEDDPDGLLPRAAETLDRGLDRLARNLQGEIERSAAYVEARHGEAVDRILIAGGLGGAPGLVQRLAAESHLEISPFDPFSVLGHECELPAAARPSFVQAVGAAMMATRADASANLLMADGAPEQERKRARVRARWPARRLLGAAGVAGLVLGIGAFDAHTHLRIGTLDAEIDALYEEREALRLRAHELTRNADLFDLQDRIESLRGIYRSRHLFTPFFTRVVDCLPATMRLDRVHVERREIEEDHASAQHESDADDGADVDPAAAPPARLVVSMRGRTDDVDAVGAYVVELESRKLLRRIEVLRILERQDDHSERWFEFELEGEPVVRQQGEILAALESDATSSEADPTDDTPEASR